MATAVATRLGDVDVAAHQIAFEIWSFLALALDAIAIAGQALVGRALGAGDGEGAKGAGRRMIEWGVVAGVAVGALVFALSGHLPGLFSDDAAVVDLTAFVLVWVALLQPVNAVAFVLDGILIGAGDMRFLAWAMAAAAAAFVPAAARCGRGRRHRLAGAALELLMSTRATVLLALLQATGSCSAPCAGSTRRRGRARRRPRRLEGHGRPRASGHGQNSVAQ